MPRQNVSTPIKKNIQIYHIPGPKLPGPKIPGPNIPTQTRSSSFVDSMVSGFGVGVGNSLARKMFEPKTTPVTVPAPALQLSLDDIFKKYQECLERNEPNIKCEDLLNPL